MAATRRNDLMETFSKINDCENIELSAQSQGTIMILTGANDAMNKHAIRQN
jgi:hypothetical protein